VNYSLARGRDPLEKQLFTVCVLYSLTVVIYTWMGVVTTLYRIFRV
jgi:hypothetical protein